MVCVDTSVWIAAQRGADEAALSSLEHLLDRSEVLLAVVVRVELLAGARRQDWQRWMASLNALKLALPQRATWARIEHWLPSATAAGLRFSMADLLIAALAAEAGARVWSLDLAFERMAGLGWIRLWGR